MLVQVATIEDLARIEQFQALNSLGRNFQMGEILEDENWEVGLALISEKVVGLGILQFENWNNLAWVKKILARRDMGVTDVEDMLIDFLVELASKKKCRCVIAEVNSQDPLKMIYEKKYFRGCGYNDRYINNSGQESLVYFAKDLI